MSCSYYIILYFNPRSQAGSDPLYYYCQCCHYIFQSTLPSRERPRFSSCAFAVVRISIHAPKPGATTLADGSEIVVDISIHAPKPGATWTEVPLVHYRAISIHAPKPGATGQHWRSGDLISISIHAPKPGATLDAYDEYIDNGDFNPRSQAGSDANSLPARRRTPNFNPRSQAGSDLRGNLPHGDIRISIHAPKPGATGLSTGFGDPLEFQSTLPSRERLLSFQACGCSTNFNPRSQAGSDIAEWLVADGVPEFQSTLPSRERLHRRRYVNAHDDFNPRSQAGSDI